MKQPEVLSPLFMNLDGTHFILTRITSHLGKILHISSLPRFQKVIGLQTQTNSRTNQQKLLGSLLLFQQDHSRKCWKSLNSSKKKGNKPAAIVKPNNKQSYAQVANPKITNILKLKEDYWNLPAKKIENIHKIINNLDKIKPRTKITIKGPSHKQIIIPINKDDKTKFMASSSEHIANINRTLKNIKSDVIADYVYSEHISITIVTNKVASSSDL